MDLGSDPVVDQSFKSAEGLMAFLKGDTAKKWIMYGTVSAVAIVTSWIVLGISHNLIRRPLLESQIWSTIISTIPAFYLSRRWVWAQDGKISMKREVIPFWILSIIQFFITIGILALLQSTIKRNFTDTGTQSIVVSALTLVLYGVMWIGKFFFLNNLLFRDDQPATSTL